MNMHKTNTKWLVHSLSTFGARTSHGLLRIHKTQNGSDLGEATTIPLRVFFASLHMGHIQMAFVSGLPSGSPEIPTTGILATLGTHNFMCKPSIAMRSEEKL
jgi:hypothetical protein